MKLRRQLLLVSILGLSLPWAGCQYVREMEEALRAGQNTALAATAQAVARYITNEPTLLNELQQPAAQVFSANQIYAHDFSRSIVLDGYDDEWRDRQFEVKQWQQGKFRVGIQAASHGKNLYLFFSINDEKILYHNPALNSVTQSDHLLLQMRNQEGELMNYVVNTGAPGSVNVYRLLDRHSNDAYEIEAYDSSLYASDVYDEQAGDDLERPGIRHKPEHRIKGFWQEGTGGYQVELQMPVSLTHGYLAVAAVNRQSYREDDSYRENSAAQLMIGSIEEKSGPAPLAKRNAALHDALAVFAEDNLRLRVMGKNQWLIAEAGKLQAANKLPVENRGLTTWLMRQLLTHKHLPPLDTPQYSGRLEADEIERALNGEVASRWYRYGVYNLGRVAVPVVRQGRILGSVVVEQTSAGILAQTNSAFQRLFFYTLLATLVAGVGLVAYASWISLRIRKLSHAADSAMREDGKLENKFSVSSAQDEIGDLNRSYAKLLTRLQEYTDYLRTLANKLSHELRTPLAVVRSSLDNLDNENLDQPARVFATRAQEGSERLSSILNAISSASRVEESIRHADKELFALDKVVRELAQAYQDIAAQKILCEIEENEPCFIFGSPDLIVQMIDKLFDNACDFCPPDGKITFSLSKNKHQVILTISNDGPLLPEKMQSQLFDSLVSLREKEPATSTKDDKIHLGLGLHIVRLIVEVHDARVTARNRKDLLGVEFEIIFHAG